MANATRTTVVGIFKDNKTAQDVVGDLTRAGIPGANVHVGSQANWTSNVAAGGSALTGQAPEHRHGGFMGWLEGLFSSPDSDDERKRYSEAVGRGNCVVAVDASETDRDRVEDIMEKRGALDIDEQAPGDSNIPLERNREYPKASAPPLAGTSGVKDKTKSIPVVQEELQVGKRAVQRGGVRIYTKTVEQPVEEKINLREEKVRVERRPTDRPATPADSNQMRDQTIEVTEMAEEPVISKRARVVEEVVVGKDATERTETVRDTLRNQQVEVERMNPSSGATTAAPGSYESDFHSNFEANYTGPGSTYEMFAPAYAYGARMTDDARYRGRRFEDVEDMLKTDYLRNNPNSSWDRMRGAVRYGWERATKKR